FLNLAKSSGTGSKACTVPSLNSLLRHTVSRPLCAPASTIVGWSPRRALRPASRPNGPAPRRRATRPFRSRSIPSDGAKPGAPSYEIGEGALDAAEIDDAGP